MNRLLQQALKAAGSIAGLARKLRLSPSTIGRWKRQGLPKTGNAKERLEAYRQERQRLREREKSERATFHELMKLAGEARKLSKPRTKSGRRVGRRTSGDYHTKAFNRDLTLDTLDDIEVWAAGVRSRFPTWQASALVSQYGRGEHRGYKTVYHDLPHPEAGDFLIESTIATSREKTRNKAMGALRSELEELLEDATLLVYLHSVTLFNYRVRTPAESRAWETAQRRRREQWRLRKSAQGAKTKQKPKKSASKPKPQKTRPKKAKKKTPKTTRPTSTSKRPKPSKKTTKIKKESNIWERLELFDELLKKTPKKTTPKRATRTTQRSPKSSSKKSSKTKTKTKK